MRLLGSAFSPRTSPGALTNTFVQIVSARFSFGIAESLHLEKRPFLLMALILVFSYLLALPSWNMLERPFLEAKALF